MSKWQTDPQRCSTQRSGFTLVQMAIIIMILGLMGASAADVYRLYKVQSYAARDQAQIKAITAAIQTYYKQHGVLPCVAPQGPGITPTTSASFGVAETNCNAPAIGTGERVATVFYNANNDRSALLPNAPYNSFSYDLPLGPMLGPITYVIPGLTPAQALIKYPATGGVPPVGVVDYPPAGILDLPNMLDPTLGTLPKNTAGVPYSVTSSLPPGSVVMYTMNTIFACEDPGSLPPGPTPDVPPGGCSSMPNSHETAPNSFVPTTYFANITGSMGGPSIASYKQSIQYPAGWPLIPVNNTAPPLAANNYLGTPGTIVMLSMTCPYAVGVSNPPACQVKYKNSIRIGAVPVRTLGLPDSYIAEPSGNFYTYAVETYLTDPQIMTPQQPVNGLPYMPPIPASVFSLWAGIDVQTVDVASGVPTSALYNDAYSTVYANNIAAGKPGGPKGGGSLSDINADNAAKHAPGSAPYVIISPGRDGIGSYTMQGTQHAPCPVGSTNLQDHNCQVGTAAAPNALFYGGTAMYVDK